MAHLEDLAGRKQAVVLIHGIGEQRPMDTLRAFADAVLEPPDNPELPKYWSKPDSFSNSFELRRLGAPRQRDRPPTDFYEFYWQHLMQGNRLSHVWHWILSLLLRRPSQVPRQLRPLWGSSWLVIAVGASLAVWGAWTAWGGLAALGIVQWIAALALLGAQAFLLGYVADAARYLSPNPANISRRQEIRAAGVALLKGLHASSKYNRLIIVGHSLGSVIGYDLLYHTWQQFHRQHDKPVRPSQRTLKQLEAESRAGLMGQAVGLDQFRALQRDYAFELLTSGNPWLVTDFVTLGSPLAHAQMLLADDLDDFARRLHQREFPTCPPVLEGQASFSFPEHYEITVTEAGMERTQRRTLRAPHHAACFAPVRWTNIYFPCRKIIFGDLIGGPLCDSSPPPSRRFGMAIQDVEVQTRARGGLFSHTCYWRLHPKDKGPAAPLLRLREALALDDRPVWSSRLASNRAVVDTPEDAPTASSEHEDQQAKPLR